MILRRKLTFEDGSIERIKNNLRFKEKIALNQLWCLQYSSLTPYCAQNSGHVHKSALQAITLIKIDFNHAWIDPSDV